MTGFDRPRAARLQGDLMGRNGWVAAVTFGVAVICSPVSASPWAEVGDAQLRSDIEILANAGVIDDVTTQWPIPWAGIISRMQEEDVLANQPIFVREAARRVREKAGRQLRIGDLRASVSIDLTNRPDIVRGFDATGLGEGQGQLSLEYMTSTTAARLSAGIFAPQLGHGKKLFMPDGSYVAQKVGGALIYAGYLTHWWGPGWISALSYSNNARPFPQVGIERDTTEAFHSRWLSWLGPWQLEFVVGWFDDKRVATNTFWDGLRLSLNPLPGLQIGIARTDELCGKGHPCKPLATYFDFRNDPAHPSRTNDQGVIDVHYTHTLFRVPFEIYAQVMNEDSNPITHSASSHLFGASVWTPIGGQNVRTTIEYTDSIATRDIFSFGDDLFGVTYNDTKYIDGLRYRGRDLGFSLDSDSRLFSLQASAVDAGDRTFTLTFNRAQISSPLTGTRNPLTTSPVTIDIGEARVSVPWSWAKLDIEARVQDDQPRPKRGATAALEVALVVDF
jgi:hypothetical protein